MKVKFNACGDSNVEGPAVDIYSDGSCFPNPGNGGWAAILRYKNHELIISGHEKNTSNNRMELLGALNGLKALNRPCIVTIHSDSMYVVNGAKGKWKQGMNHDLWKELVRIANNHNVSWIWVKGHSANPMNNKADKYANKAMNKRVGVTERSS